MHVSSWFNKKPFACSILLIIIFNALLVRTANLSLFDQSLNILLSIGIFEYFKNKQLKTYKKTKLFDIVLSLFILLFTLYKSFLTYTIENHFIYLVLPLLLISTIIFNFSCRNFFLGVFS